MSLPQISVITPVWDDYVELLGAAVASVVGQEGPAVELIVVDNASKRPLPELPEHVRVVRTERRLSVGAARNRGIAEARGEWLCFVDADDQLLDGALATLAAAVERQDDVVAAAGRVTTHIVARDERKPHPLLPLRKAYHLAPYPRAFALTSLVSYLLPVVGGSLLRREAVIDAGGFPDLEYAEDWSLSIGLAFRGRVVMVDEPVRLYRLQRGSLYFRVHPRSTSLRSLREIRARVATDQRIPGPVRALRPLLAAAHWAKVRRHTPGGLEDPAAFYIGPEDGVGGEHRGAEAGAVVTSGAQR